MGLSDATQLSSAAQSVARAASAVPRMESFITAMVDIVYVQSEDVLPLEFRGEAPRDPTKVLGCMAHVL